MWSSLSSVVRRGLRITLTDPSILRRLSSSTIKVDPFCLINIKTSSPLEIRPYDLLDCPNANVIRYTTSNGCHNALDVLVHERTNNEDQQVVNIDDNLTSKARILLEVPVKADLNVESCEDVHLANFHSDNITVTSLKDIVAKNLKSRHIRFHSNAGRVECQDTTLAYNLEVRTDQDGVRNGINC